MAGAALTDAAGTRRRRYLMDRKGFLGPLLLLPAVVYLVAVVGYPLVLAIMYAFSDVTVGSSRFDLVGFSTFAQAVTDPQFPGVLANTFIITGISQALVVVLCTMLALLLRSRFRGKWFLRFIVLMPWTTPIALGTIIWLWMLDSIFTPFDWFARALHIIGPGEHLNMLGHDGLAMGSVIAVQTWRVLPLATIIVLAGLTSIPQDVNEQAQIDGAGFWRRLFGIEIPLIAPVILVAVLFGIIFTFTDMTVVFVLTGGGPANATQVLASLAFYKGINGGNLSGGAADALFMFPVLLIMAVVTLRWSARLGSR